MDDTTLTSLPIVSLQDGATLKQNARAAGLSNQQINAVIDRELSEHGGPNYTWFKVMVFGAGISAMGLLWAGTQFFEGRPYPTLALLLVSFCGLSIWKLGQLKQRNCALAAAVLRAHTQGMRRSQIAVLKRSYRLDNDKQTRSFLTRVQNNQSH